MATVQTPVRQPFGILNESKLRSLQSIKNRQNALTPNSNTSLKRRAPSPDTSDTENVDPNILSSLKKRKCAAFNDDVSISKQPRLYTTVVPSPSRPRVFTPTATTPRIDTVSKPSKTPLSAPAAAAGRSPTRTKGHGILSRKRFVPPSLGTKSPGLSVAAALKGTLAGRKMKKARTIEESKPSSWFFDIFEESEEQQDYRMNEWTMTQSSAALDISDDESKSNDKRDRGKENVDPNEVFAAPVTRSMAAAAAKVEAVPKVSRKDAMIDEPRTPLGDLNAADYYAEGLDATSVVLVQEDAPTEEQEQTERHLEAPSVDDFTFEAPLSHTSEQEQSLENSSPFAEVPEWAKVSTSISIDAVLEQSNSTGDIEIWESASAQDENEKREREQEVTLDDANGFALQEL